MTEVEVARTRVLRELAVKSSRPAAALGVPVGCALKTWSALATTLPSRVHVLGVSATRPPGAPPPPATLSAGSGGGCPLWLRLQNLSPAPRLERGGFEEGSGYDDLIDAAAVAEALSPGEVILHPTRIAGGEIGYAFWNRPCAHM